MRNYYRLKVTVAGVTRLKWIEVQTDANGYNDAVRFTNLCQQFLLSINESPFYSLVGIPAQQSVIQQVAPDYYVQLTQQRNAPYFISLTVARVKGTIDPTYNVRAVFHDGSQIIQQLSSTG